MLGLHQLLAGFTRLLGLGLAAAATVVAWDAWGGKKSGALVVFRCDDYSPWFPPALGHSFTNVASRYGIPIHLSVVPATVAEDGTTCVPLDPGRVDFLRQGVKAGYFEVSLHGLQHARSPEGVSSEFGGLPLPEQSARLRKALDLLADPFGVQPEAFVPPWHAWDLTTLEAMSRAGLSTLSARDIPADFEAAIRTSHADMHYLPSYSSVLGLAVSIQAAVSTGDPQALVMTMAHPADFKDWGAREFDSYFKHIKELPGARIVNMADVLKESPGYTMSHWFDLRHARQVWADRRESMRQVGMDPDLLLPLNVYSSPRHLTNIALRYHSRRVAAVLFALWLPLVLAQGLWWMVRRGARIRPPTSPA